MTTRLVTMLLLGLVGIGTGTAQDAADEPGSDLTRGLAALQRGDWPSVIAHLEPLRSRFPDLPELQYALALAYYQQQRYRPARDLLQGVLQQPDPQDGDLLNLFAMSAYALHDYQAAEGAWRRVLAEHPGTAAAAQAASGMDRLTDDPDVLVHRGLNALRAAEPQRALRLLEPALAQRPDDGDLALAVAVAAEAVGDRSLAARQAQRALELGSSDPERARLLLDAAAAETDQAGSGSPAPESTADAADDPQWRPSIFARSGWFWDSNPGLTADTVGLDPADLEDDQYFLVDLYAEIRQPAGWGLSGFGMFQNYQDLDDNDLGYGQLRVDYTLLGEQTRLRLGLQGNRTWLGGEAITESPSVDAALRWQPNAVDSIRLRAGAAYLRYLDEIYADQEGFDLGGSLRWRRQLDAERRWRGEAQLAVRNFAAEEQEESYVQLEPRLALRWRIEHWQAAVQTRGRWRWYAEPPSGPAEEEQRYGIGTELSWTPNPRWSIVASYEWQQNVSNLPDQDWERIEAGLTVGFSWY